MHGQPYPNHCKIFDFSTFILLITELLVFWISLPSTFFISFRLITAILQVSLFASLFLLRSPHSVWAFCVNLSLEIIKSGMLSSG